MRRCAMPSTSPLSDNVLFWVAVVLFCFYQVSNTMTTRKKAGDFVDNVQRRTWDVAAAEERGRKRREEEESKDDSSHRENEHAIVQRAPLRQRDFQVDLFSKVGKYQVVTSTTPLSQRGGFYCDLCECLLKDSVTYLDHINGKRHQRKLGMNMRPERSSLEQVQARLDQHKRKKDEEEAQPKLDIAERLARWEREPKNKRQRRKHRDRERQEREALFDQAQQDSQQTHEQVDGEEGDEDDIDDEPSAAAIKAVEDASNSNPSASRTNSDSCSSSSNAEAPEQKAKVTIAGGVKSEAAPNAQAATAGSHPAKSKSAQGSAAPPQTEEEMMLALGFGGFGGSKRNQ